MPALLLYLVLSLLNLLLLLHNNSVLHLDLTLICLLFGLESFDRFLSTFYLSLALEELVVHLGGFCPLVCQSLLYLVFLSLSRFQ
jgi:hypothetical protein